MDDISSKDLLILKEKARTYRGSFKVPLDQIDFEVASFHPRQQDPKNTARLLQSFSLEGCNRLQPENFISALVDADHLAPQAVFSDRHFAEPPSLSSGCKVVCLDGYHRVQAAREFLAGDERWWAANLYIDGSIISDSWRSVSGHIPIWLWPRYQSAYKDCPARTGFRISRVFRWGYLSPHSYLGIRGWFASQT